MGRELRFYIDIHHSCLFGKGMRIDKTFAENKNNKTGLCNTMKDDVDKALDEFFKGSCGLFGDNPDARLPGEADEQPHPTHVSTDTIPVHTSANSNNESSDETPIDEIPPLLNDSIDPTTIISIDAEIKLIDNEIYVPVNGYVQLNKLNRSFHLLPEALMDRLKELDGDATKTCETSTSSSSRKRKGLTKKSSTNKHGDDKKMTLRKRKRKD